MFSSGSPPCSAEQDGFSNFGRGSPKEHFCEIIEKSVQQCQRRSLLKQKLQYMHVNFYGKSAPLMAFEGLMNRWMNEYTNKWRGIWILWIDI